MQSISWKSNTHKEKAHANLRPIFPNPYASNEKLEIQTYQNHYKTREHKPLGTYKEINPCVHRQERETERMSGILSFFVFFLVAIVGEVYHKIYIPTYTYSHFVCAGRVVVANRCLCLRKPERLRRQHQSPTYARCAMHIFGGWFCVWFVYYVYTVHMSISPVGCASVLNSLAALRGWCVVMSGKTHKSHRRRARARMYVCVCPSLCSAFTPTSRPALMSHQFPVHPDLMRSTTRVTTTTQHTHTQKNRTQTSTHIHILIQRAHERTSIPHTVAGNRRRRVPKF